MSARADRSTGSGREELADEQLTGVDLGRVKLVGRLFRWLCIAASLFGVVMLALLIADVLYEAAVGVFVHEFDLTVFFFESASRHPHQAGFYGALLGSLWLMVFTVLLSFFVGVGSAIYLEEYAPDNRITRLIEANLTNLAGVPSIVYGLLVLAVIVNGANLGSVILSGAIALALLVMPIIIVSSQEALRAVPAGVRNGSYATGATQWQTIRQVVLPAALPGMMTGTILALARAIGETAPLIMAGAILSAIRTPSGPFSSFGSMPTQIYHWATRPDSEFHNLAAMGIVVLLAIMISMNAVAVYVRSRYEREL